MKTVKSLDAVHTFSVYHFRNITKASFYYGCTTQKKYPQLSFKKFNLRNNYSMNINELI